jgi:PKD repeat protein/uncharacterized protein YraI
MTEYWSSSSTVTKVIIVAAIAAVACGAAVLCVLGLGLLGVFELPLGATPTSEVAPVQTPVQIGRVTGIVVVVPTPESGSPTAAVVCRVDILSGPGEGYERIGVVEEGQTAHVIGVSQDGQWWVIKVAQAKTTQGWVSAKCLAVENAENVPVAPPPPTPTPTPPPPIVITGWKGEYFANRDLQGDPVLVRDDPDIKFDWGTGSPAPEVPPDNFSASWTISREVPAGTYRFNIWVDDGMRMWIDDVLIIDGWVEGATRNYNADVNLAAGTHNVRVEYFEAVGNAMIILEIGAVEPPPPSDGPPQAVISGPTEAQVGQPVVFSARNSSVAPGSHLTTFEWTFGDGTRAQGVDVTHIYTNPGDYEVTLNVTDDKARSNTAAQPIKIVPAPTAPTATPTVPSEGPDAVINAPSQGVVGQPITFDGGGSTGPNPIVSYRWAFGDGSTADAVTVEKTYGAVGVYNVTLTVTDDNGLEDSEGLQINIVEAPPPDATDTPVPEVTDTPVPEATDTPVPEVTDTPVPEVTDTPVPEETPTPEEQVPPTAVINGPTAAQVGESVTFDGSASASGSSPIASYQWNFGDGGTGTGAVVNYTYSSAGEYTVTLVVTDENQLTGEATSGISVTE